MKELELGPGPKTSSRAPLDAGSLSEPSASTHACEYTRNSSSLGRRQCAGEIVCGFGRFKVSTTICQCHSRSSIHIGELAVQYAKEINGGLVITR